MDAKLPDETLSYQDSFLPRLNDLYSRLPEIIAQVRKKNEARIPRVETS